MLICFNNALILKRFGNLSGKKIGFGHPRILVPSRPFSQLFLLTTSSRYTLQGP